MSTPDEQETDWVTGDVVDVYPLRTDDRPEPVGFIVLRPDGSEPLREPAEEDPTGPVERALRVDLSRLRLTGQLAGTLVASAVALAQAMDNAPADKIAGIGRELREHVKRIEEIAGDDDDTQRYRTDLSTPV